MLKNCNILGGGGGTPKVNLKEIIKLKMLTNVPRLQTLLKLHMLGADKGRLNPIWKQKEMDKT